MFETAFVAPFSRALARGLSAPAAPVARPCRSSVRLGPPEGPGRENALFCQFAVEEVEPVLFPEHLVADDRHA